MPQVLKPPENFPGVQILVQRKIRFSVIPLISNLPDRTNNAGEVIDINIVNN